MLCCGLLRVRHNLDRDLATATEYKKEVLVFNAVCLNKTQKLRVTMFHPRRDCQIQTLNKCVPNNYVKYDQ